MWAVCAGGGVKGAARRHFPGVRHSPVQQSGTHSTEIILFLPSDNFCAYVLQPGSLSASLPMLLGAPLCLSFQHPSEASSALIPQVPGRNWEAWDGQAAGINCGHTRNWLYTKNYPKAQTYVSNLCFNSQVGEKSKLQLIKKG